jgi:hypothetical protein
MGDFRRYRQYEPKEFLVAFADTAAGGGDYCAVQFLSKTKIDIPVVYHSHVLATEMTPRVHSELETIYDKTGVQPVISYERNNGGVFELERLASLNRLGKYRIYQQKKNVGSVDSTENAPKLGWDTNSATRPAMLSMLKEAIDSKLLKIYDKPTINEMFSFIINQTSSRWKAEAERGAHDDCFTVGHLVTTDKGQIPIEKIRPGDMVLTTNGYRPVIHTRNSYKDVITKYGLTGTPDHPIITSKGNKRFGSVKASDKIYIWNEKQSSITESSITDTLNPSADNLESITGDTTSGRGRPSRSIGKFGLTLTEKYRRVRTSTTKTRIPLTTILETLSLSLGQTIRKNIWQMNKDESCTFRLGSSKQQELLKILSGGDEKTHRKLEKFIEETDKRKLLELRDNSKSGVTIMLIKAEKSIEPTGSSRLKDSKPQTKFGENLTQTRYRLKPERALWLTYTIKPKRNLVNSVASRLLLPVNLAQSIALKTVGRKQDAKQKVYNIQVADTPEYFVNGVLVHNCIMSLAGAWQLYQSEQPIIKKRANKSYGGGMPVPWGRR